MLIIIKKEWKQTIVKNSEEDKEFVNKLRIRISDINMTNILDSNILFLKYGGIRSITGI